MKKILFFVAAAGLIIGLCAAGEVYYFPPLGSIQTTRFTNLVYRPTWTRTNYLGTNYTICTMVLDTNRVTALLVADLATNLVLATNYNGTIQVGTNFFRVEDLQFRK